MEAGDLRSEDRRDLESLAERWGLETLGEHLGGAVTAHECRTCVTLPRYNPRDEKGTSRLSRPGGEVQEVAMPNEASDDRMGEKMRRWVPKEAREHLRAARKEIHESARVLLPPEFLAHRRAARREMLLAARSLIDHALERLQEKGAV